MSNDLLRPGVCARSDFPEEDVSLSGSREEPARTGRLLPGICAPMPVIESLVKASQLSTGSFPALGDPHYSASRA